MEVNRQDVLAEVEAVFNRYEHAFQQNDLEVLDELFWDDVRVVRVGVGEDNYGIDEVRSAATAFIEFRREASGVEGRQSQTWARTSEGWRVVAAHVSHLAPSPAVV
jgi:ketosteroid isomerase-like protein